MVSTPLSSKAKFSILFFIFVSLAIALGEPGTLIGAELPSGIQILKPGVDQTVNPDVKVILSDSTRLVFEVSPPEIVRSTIKTDAGRFEQVRIPGYGYLGIDGYPDLPQTNFLVAIPPGAVPELTILDVQSHVIEGVRVLPAAQQRLLNGHPNLVWDLSDFVPEFETNYPVNWEAYTSDEFYPAYPAELGDVFWVRDRHVVRVFVQPVLANSHGQTLTIYSNLRVQLTFRQSYGLESLALETRQEGSAYEAALSDRLLNFEESRGWRLHRDFGSEPQTSPCMDGNAFRLAIDETSMYEVPFGDLSSSGWPSGVSVDDMRMCYQDSEVAIRILDDNSDGDFNGSDSLFFYGQAIKTQETTTNIYWLSYFTDGNAGKRMGVDNDTAGGVAPDHYQSSFHLEVDAQYYSSMPMNDDNDHWYWRSPLIGRAGDPNQSMSTDFYLPDPVTDDGSDFPLRVMIWAFFRPEWHRVEVKLNDQPLGPEDFYGSGLANNSLLYEASVPSSFLREDGANVITVVALPHPDNHPDFPHIILVDWMEAEPYRYLEAKDNHLALSLTPGGAEDTTITASGFLPGNAQIDIYDVTNPQDVTWQQANASSGSVSFRRILSSTRSFELVKSGLYLAPQSIMADSSPPSLLSDPNNEADMIIITAPSLDNALTPLRSLRSSQGLTVKTVYVQDIFDEFSFGLYSTEAIRDFLSYAYENWSGSREYVLLAGEGSYDHRDLLGMNGPGGNLVPVYLRSGIDRTLGEAASDNQYVDLDGDDLADMMLGRLPARNSAELTNMVDKILAYEAGPITAPWRARHLFVTDNGLVPSETGCQVDPAADFFAVVDDFIDTFFPANHLLNRISYAPSQCYQTPEPYFASTVFQMQAGIVQKYNAGNQFVVYTGHSSLQEWGHEDFLNVQLANGFVNGNNTPIMLPMTCLVGIYHFPQGDNLSETLLKLVGGGSVASYAPTGFQVQNGHDYLLEGFYTGVFSDGVRLLGQAVYAAKLNLDSGPSVYQDLHDTYMLLGDPAMRIDMPDSVEQIFLPVTTN